MRKSKFTESQIVKTIKEVEGGRPVKSVCRELGISEATYYNWKSKYGGDLPAFFGPPITGERSSVA